MRRNPSRTSQSLHPCRHENTPAFRKNRPGTADVSYCARSARETRPCRPSSSEEMTSCPWGSQRGNAGPSRRGTGEAPHDPPPPHAARAPVSREIAERATLSSSPGCTPIDPKTSSAHTWRAPVPVPPHPSAAQSAQPVHLCETAGDHHFRTDPEGCPAGCSRRRRRITSSTSSRAPRSGRCPPLRAAPRRA